MTNTWPELNHSELRDALLGPSAHFSAVHIVESTGSTNADLAGYATADAGNWPDLSVLLANAQIEGKGRLGRGWQVPAGSSMISSVLLRPSESKFSGKAQFSENAYAWLSILAGVAACRSVVGLTGVAAKLKWPNDVVVEGRKLAGILAQLVPTKAGPAVVVGLGMNVHQGKEDLPVERATSLVIELESQGSVAVDRNQLITAYLSNFAALYGAFVANGGDVYAPLGSEESLMDQASAAMATLGSQVRAELPGGHMLHGTAMSLAPGGELCIQDHQGKLHAISAADVVHLRKSDSQGLKYA